MKKILTITLLSAMALVSCRSMDETGLPEPGEAVVLQPRLLIPSAGEASATRSGLGLGLPNGRLTKFSLCVVPDDEGTGATPNSEWYHDRMGYDNIAVVNSPTSSTYDVNTGKYLYNRWSYMPRGGTRTTINTFGLYPNHGKTYTIYGVHPYMENFHENAADLTAVGFEINDTNAINYDYMIVGPVAVDISAKQAGSTINATLPLTHIMAAVELQLTNTHHGTLVVDSVKFELLDGAVAAAEIGMRGTFSAVDGSVSVEPGSEISGIMMKYGSSVGYKHSTYVYNRYTPYTLIIPPVAHVAGRKIRATIYFNYVGDDDLDLVGLGGTVDFNFDDIETNGSHQGLVGGYRYVYKVEVDNFIKYHGYPEVEPWVAPDENDPDDDQTKDIIF